MKKIIFYVLFLFFSISGYSQLTEGFESTTGPDALPSTNWTLGSGSTGNQWAVFDNGVGTAQRWGINAFASTLAYQGSNCASVSREFIGQNNTSEDYLSTPLVTIPTNGQLHFYTRTFTTGNQGTLYQIKVAPASASQTNPAAYALVQQWTEVTLTALYNVYEEKVVDLSAYAGQQVYVSFVKVYTQPTASLDGDRWLIDNVNIVQQCLDPTTLTATGITQTSANLSWANPSGATSWEIEVLPAAATATGVGVVYNGPLSYLATATATGTPFTPSTAYKYYVRALCSTGANSLWVGPFPFSTTSPGLSCAAPIVIGALPYSTTDNTSNYSDNPAIEGSPGASGCGSTNAYLNGNDVVYSYTAATTGTINVAMTPTATYSGIFAYSSCANIGVSCLAGAANSGTGVRTFNLPVTAGSTYYFVISTWATPQTTAYTLTIQTVNCAPPTTLSASNMTLTSAQLSWANPSGATSWEVAVQSAGSSIPSGPGTQTNVNTNYPVSGLTANTAYQYYVRADCGNGTFSAWAGPFLFSTTPGLSCSFPNTITSLPYTTTDDTANYSDNPAIEGSPGASGCGSTNGYLNGNDVVYAYTAATTGIINVNMAPTATYSGIFAYNSCSGIGASCLAGVANSGTGPRNFDLNVTAGTTYYFVISTWATPQTTAYTLTIQALNCAAPTTLAATNISQTGAQLSWGNPSGATSWEIAVQNAGASIPSGSGVQTNNNTAYPVTGLTSGTNYQYYVRADCGNGTFSPWSGPFPFSTLVNYCAGNHFYDTGGPTGNYLNSQNITTTICPNNPGDQVTVDFNSFNVENTYDFLKIYDGDNALAPLLGNFTGTTLPPSFTSSAASGCLTFVFTSDTVVPAPGWDATITCLPPPTCPKPNTLITSAITQTGASITWTEAGTATQWEVYIVTAGSPVPTASSVGVLTSTNSYTFSNLTPATGYDVYIRAICSSTDISLWSNKNTFYTLIANDDCATATVVPVNPTTACVQTALGILIGATPSGLATTCAGTPDDDVWFQFTATSNQHSISLINVVGSTTDLYHILYSGACGTLTQLYCSDANSSIATGLVVGQTYYIRVYSYTATTGQTSTFNVCVGTIPPPIATNTYQYTTQQLVEDIFLNSSCASVSNVTSSTGTNFGSTNGIGYFNQNGSAFPFTDGILLTTGNAINAPGPNSSNLSDGATGWTGDAQLEAIILAATGNAMNSKNASKLEFDFVPLVNTINFNFIFASEEYGTFQCDYSDAFAFLLTNIATGTTTNLAVVPNTTTPVSVVTIRDQLYNNSCSSVNPQYFGSYYGAGGLDPLESPTNFNGRTVPLTATSTVIPGNQYHIKLVIADRLDTLYDSAVFLEGGSLNIGNVDLGTDFLQATNNALCFGDSYTIQSGLNPAQYTFTWTFNGNPIPNETGPNLTVTQSGTYGIAAQFINTTCAATDSITIEYYSPIVPGTPNNLTACDNSGFSQFDLSQNNAASLGSLVPAQYNVSYFATNADAIAETNALPTLYTNTTANLQTVYVRIENSSSGCFEVRPFNLIVNPLVDPTFSITTSICQSDVAPVLPTTSLNGITGTWSPSTVSNLQTADYVFTPTPGSCNNSKTITVTVIPPTVPSFLSPAPICNGDVAPTLPTTSLNGVTGTWSPAVVDNTQTATYTFTPNPNQCASPTTMSITVLQNCAFGSYASAVWLTNCATNNFFNTVGSGASIIGPAQNIFPNTYLGTYIQNSNTLILRGAELKTFKTTTANVCSARLNYRIYPASGTPGAFTVMNLPFFDDCNAGTFPTGGPCTNGDQKWQRVLDDSQSPINLTTYPAGNYVLEVYYDVTGDVTSATECDDTLFINNNGSNFIATFSIQQNPTYAATHPSGCNATDGAITIGNLTPINTYSLTYLDGSTTVGPIPITADASGQYVITGLNAGIYSNFHFVVNGCTFTSTDVVTLVDQPIIPTFTNFSICLGDTSATLPTASLNGITGTWSPSTIDNTQTTTYTFNPTAGQCATTGSLVITINQPIAATFNALPTVCNGGTVPTLPVTSIEGYTGTWSPSVVDNTQTLTYTFTPTAGQCATTGFITVTVTPTTTPTFPIGTAVTACAGFSPQVLLPGTSNEGITGTWLPSTLDYSIVGTTVYTFTPNAGQCATNTTLTTFIIANVTPTFTAVAPICNGDALSALPTTSNNGYTGTWSPALNNTATTIYTFTPTTGQCATTATLTITVNQKVTPTFNAIAPLCIGDTAPALPTSSIEGITGTWLPATIDNTISGTYTFTPDAGQCANNGSLAVTVQSSFDFALDGNCIGNDFTITVSALNTSFDVTTANYTWYNSNGQSVGTNANTFNVTEYLASTSAAETPPIDFSVTVTTVDGCSKSHTITLDRVFCEIQKGISANHDGLNDYFDLTGYNVKHLSIFNRYGLKVYSKSAYTNQWGGQSDKDEELPDGTYYYVIDFNDNQSAKTGWIYINREQ
ncbi:choice-of-anchor L domain-containing protein [Flavobacterium sp.]|uniref:choice-of-anchor L domain-containing protein n=1 Tax=Flavobacterium sp. TaxID=239 RepID=UPI002FD96EF5